MVGWYHGAAARRYFNWRRARESKKNRERRCQISVSSIHLSPLAPTWWACGRQRFFSFWSPAFPPGLKAVDMSAGKNFDSVVLASFFTKKPAQVYGCFLQGRPERRKGSVLEYRSRYHSRANCPLSQSHQHIWTAKKCAKDQPLAMDDLLQAQSPPWTSLKTSKNEIHGSCWASKRKDLLGSEWNQQSVWPGVVEVFALARKI